jgi:hypothetical protein
VSLATGRQRLAPPTSARDRLVDALTTVESLTVYRSAPDNPVAWDAFPRWALSDYRSGRLAAPSTHAYDVLVILPAGYEPDTVEQGESLLDTVASALYPVADVQTAEPIALTFGTTPAVPALRIRVIPRVP